MYHAIVFLPLAGFLIAGLFGRSIGAKASEFVTTGFLLVAAALSWVAFFQVALGDTAGFTVPVLRFIQVGGMDVSWAFRIDTLTVVMLVVVNSVSALVHGTTVATNQLLEDRPDGTGHLGFVTTEGFEFILEIARQSVPDGYGNSYFWVKPPRIVPVHRVKTVGGRLDHLGMEVRPFDEEGAVEVARSLGRLDLLV